MLKIKDNVDLKELENQCWEHNGQHSYIKHSKNYKVHFSIDDKSKQIGIYVEFWEKDLDILYDLIKADLVEKVEE